MQKTFRYKLEAEVFKWYTVKVIIIGVQNMNKP